MANTRKHTLTPEQRKEKMDAIEKQLTDGVKGVLNSDDWKNYLQTMSKFHDYSARNCLLMMLQRPDVTLVAGFKAWQTKFKRSVRKGEKGMQILGGIPCKGKEKQVDRVTGEEVEVEYTFVKYFPTYVWDISQTDGEPLPEVPVKDLQGYDGTMLLSQIICASPVPVIWEDIKDGAHGYYSRVEDSIHLKTGMSQTQTLKTLIHEIAHSIMHREDSPLANTNRMEREVQAESVAYMVCNYFGIDSSDYSFGYIAGWGSGMETKDLFNSLDSIRKVAFSLIDNIESKSPMVTSDLVKAIAQEDDTTQFVASQATMQNEKRAVA